MHKHVLQHQSADPQNCHCNCSCLHFASPLLVGGIKRRLSQSNSINQYFSFNVQFCFALLSSSVAIHIAKQRVEKDVTPTPPRDDYGPVSVILQQGQPCCLHDPSFLQEVWLRLITPHKDLSPIATGLSVRMVSNIRKKLIPFIL